MKDLIEHIEEILREKYPLPAKAFTSWLYWAPTDSRFFGICAREGRPVRLLSLAEQHSFITANNLELLEQEIAKMQADFVRKEAELRGILKREIARLGAK